MEEQLLLPRPLSRGIPLGVGFFLLVAAQVFADPVLGSVTIGNSRETSVSKSSLALTEEALVETNALGLSPAGRPLRAPLREIISTNLAPPKVKAENKLEEFQVRLETARMQLREKSYSDAEKNLRYILEHKASEELQREALLELAQVARDSGDMVRAQQIYGQFVHLYPDDSSIPEVFLRQGLIYRDMGATTLAMTKFYSVMSSSLNLKLDRLEYYRRVVLQAQTEIADTYYSQGKYADAADFFTRLLKENNPELNEEIVLYKIIRCLSVLDRHEETVSKGEQFLTTPKYADAQEVPEIRFLVANSLRKLGRSQEALQQVLLLLQAQQKNAAADTPTWHYWQQRTGNEIANQLYLEKDYVNALSVYTCLANLNNSPGWQMPVWYQIGLVFEQLHQPAKAIEYYDRIVAGQKDLSSEASSESLFAVIGMAKWRKEHLAWQAKAESFDRDFAPSKSQ